MPTPHNTEPNVPGWLPIGFWACVVISIAVVTRRLVALVAPSQSNSSQMTELDRVFAAHISLTLVHILPALAFVLVVPFALLRRFSRLAWPEPLIFALGTVVGATAYAMGTYAFGSSSL